jgi:hypothetical protein
MMKRNRKSTIDQLRQSLLRLDSESIDRLYGLEPLWEPGAQPHLAAEEFLAVRCPYCGERLVTRVELTPDDAVHMDEAAYIEDCEVCCRPIEFHPERDEAGALVAVRVQRLE